jgi:membrane-bound lytic murein transglycosylase D
MLKTQFSKAIYLCLFCFITSSFVIAPNTGSTISVPDDASTLPLSSVRVGLAPLGVTEIQTSKALTAPTIKLNKQALLFANHYIKTSAEDLASIKQRSKTPFSIMDAVFSRYGLPVELKYLAVIESELKTSALSRVGALGPWQLMPSTAHDLGLKITRQYDERTSYSKSTKAAALYLRDLYAQFGDWLLVLAAYNAGPRPVYTAIKKSGSRNFWALQSYLPAETRGHVKRFIATHYYFEGQGSVTTLTKAENIAFNRSVSAFALAHSAPVQVETNWAISTLFSDLTGTTGLSYKISPRKEETKESQDNQFKRIMKESEKTLQKANKAMGDVARRA